VILRLLSYNIRYGGVGREAQLASVVSSCAPDLVMLQEATKPAVVEQVAKRTGMAAWGAQSGHSLGFISRIPVTRFEWHRPFGARHSFLEIVPSRSCFTVFGVHLSAIHSNITEQRRRFELRALLHLVRRRNENHALVGDFNTLAPGEQLDVRDLPLRLRAIIWLTGGEIRWQTIKRVLAAGYVDVYRKLHPLEHGYTFPTWSPHVRLDYLFLKQGQAGRIRSCVVADSDAHARAASDHFPLFAEMEVD
jgi:endonuclease/exonuclease/phosphatase family metal-dependent hydrolase